MAASSQTAIRADLDELRELQSNAGEFLVELEARERARTGIANLKVEYNRVHGFYIEVTNAQAQKVPDDYRRRQTLKNAERYITPELKAFEDKALSAKDRALALEKSLFEALARSTAGARTAAAAHRARAGTDRRARLLRRTRVAPRLVPTAVRRGQPARVRGRPPSGGRGAGRALHPQRQRDCRRRAGCC